MTVHAQNFKLVKVTPPQVIVDDAAWTTTEIDTLGFDYLTVVLHLGATDIAMAACALQSSNTSGSGFTTPALLDTDGDTDADGNAATLPTATDDNGFVIWEVDLRGRDRYWDLSITAGDGTNGTYATAFAMLTRGDETPTTAAERGALNVLRV